MCAKVKVDAMMNNAVVTKLLEQHDRLEWTVQGLGMLRTYLSDKVRLHIWHADLAVPFVSTIHSHPWDFSSVVVSGRITNRLFRILPGPITHYASRIKCGPGGGLIPGSESGVRLDLASENIVIAGGNYTQEASWLHETSAADGTVTLISRVFKEDTEHAIVCYPSGTEWVSAEPRPATKEEVSNTVSSALALLRAEASRGRHENTL